MASGLCYSAASNATWSDRGWLSRVSISFGQICQNSPRLHWRLLQKWQQALKEADDWLAAINFGTARQRVGNFVLKMRHATDPGVTTLFAREDMGAMMDLKLETVSREISALVREGAIEPLDKSGRLYRVLDETRLQPASAA